MKVGDGVHPILQTKVVRRFDADIKKYWYAVMYYAIENNAIFLHSIPDDYKRDEPRWYSHSRTLDKKIALQRAKAILETADAPTEEIVATFTKEIT